MNSADIILKCAIEKIFPVKEYGNNFSVCSVLARYINTDMMIKRIIFKAIKNKNKNTIEKLFRIYNSENKNKIYVVKLSIEMFIVPGKTDERQYYNYFLMQDINEYPPENKDNENIENDENKISEIKEINDKINKEIENNKKYKNIKIQKDNAIRMQENEIIRIIEDIKYSYMFKNKLHYHSTDTPIDFS